MQYNLYCATIDQSDRADGDESSYCLVSLRDRGKRDHTVVHYLLKHHDHEGEQRTLSCTSTRVQVSSVNLRRKPVEKTLECYNDRISLLSFSIMVRTSTYC